MNPAPETCPFRIGERVTVNPKNKYADSWPGDYAVVGVVWEYQDGDGTRLNIAIADDDDIAMGNGSTDGWRVDDLLPARAHGAELNKEKQP